MQFDTNSSSCPIDFGERELSFLTYKIIEVESKEYGGFDPAGSIFRKILKILLSLNKTQTIKFIESLDSEVKFEIVSNEFGALSGRFQSKNFIKKIEDASKKFANSKYYKRITDNIEEAKNALDETESE